MIQSLEMPKHLVNDDLRQCIQNCLDCHGICEATTQMCLSMGGPHAEPDHIRLMKDCAEICQTSANFMLRCSDLHPLTCGVCAQICQKCANDCDRLGESMKECADACRRCAESCREMSQGRA
jgi:hypothetical protein